MAGKERTESVLSTTTGANRRSKFMNVRNELAADGGQFVDVKNFNENEDATCIEIAMLL